MVHTVIYHFIWGKNFKNFSCEKISKNIKVKNNLQILCSHHWLPQLLTDDQSYSVLSPYPPISSSLSYFEANPRHQSILLGVFEPIYLKDKPFFSYTQLLYHYLTYNPNNIMKYPCSDVPDGLIIFYSVFIWIRMPLILFYSVDLLSLTVIWWRNQVVCSTNFSLSGYLWLCPQSILQILF